MSNGFRPVFTTIHPIAGGLTRIEGARGFLEAAMLSEQWVREMGQRALLLEAHHTTHIEGTRLTLDQSRRLLEGNPVPDADLEDAKELLNYRKAFDLVSEYVSGGGPITEGLIREIHRRLVSRRAGDSACRGQETRRKSHPTGCPHQGARPVRSSGQGAEPHCRARQFDHSGLRGSLSRH